MFFTSDNGSGAHPLVIESIIKANTGMTSSYGAESAMERVCHKIRTIFESPKAAVYLVPTGTAANALALATLTKPWQTIFCHRNAHIEEDECGAPEFYTNGAKLTLVEGENAQIDPIQLDRAIQFTQRVGVHNIQRGSLSVSNVTEMGTVYSLEHMRELTATAKKYCLQTHLDGARFTNAMIKLGCDAAQMSWKSNFDAISFGGTKNGLIGVEAVIFFDPNYAWEFELRRKRGGHLFSKHRYLSAQMEAYLHDDLWIKMAQQANTTAAYFEKRLREIKHVHFLHPVDANMIFAKWPRKMHKLLREKGAQYYFWPFDQTIEGDDSELLSARLVCNWNTTNNQIDQFVDILSAP